MRKNILVGLLMVFSISCSAQKKIINSDILVKYLNTITAKELKTHLYIVASDKMGGRDTGSKGQKEAGRYLIGQYKKNNIPYPAAAKDYYQKVPADFMNKQNGENLDDSENILAFIEGSEKPEEILIISAHYDHVGIKNGKIYNGADDDGSGTVALLEIAQAFEIAKKEGYGPKRSILFFHATAEEHGLYGSQFYSENPVFPLSNTITDINIDMIGRRDKLHEKTNNYIYLIGSDFLSSDLYDICERANRNYTHLDLDYKYNDKNDPEQFYYRSDHYNFAKHGIPSVFIFNGVHDDYHKYTDDPNKIEYDALEKRTRLAFAIAWELVNGDHRPIVDKSEN